MFENKVKKVKKRRREEGKDEKETQRIRETKVKRRKLKLETKGRASIRKEAPESQSCRCFL